MTTARLREAVLKCLVETEQELEDLFEIEGATSTRLVAQDRGIESVDSHDFIYGVPHAKFINAAFAYAKPKNPNRFNDSRRGAWYSALDVETCLAEVIFHMTNVLRDAGDYSATVHYAEMFASLAGEFVDLRGQEHDCLSPDTTIGYPAGNALADAVRASGINGIIYYSVRRSAGTCIVALWPHAVQSVKQGDVLDIAWHGKPIPDVVRL